MYLRWEVGACQGGNVRNFYVALDVDIVHLGALPALTFSSV